MKNILATFFINYLLFAPLVSSAAWWNPNSWFEQEHSQVIQNSPIISEKPTPSTLVKIVEKPVDRIVTKMVTIDNPTLIKQIIDLTNTNNQLSAQISSLKNNPVVCPSSIEVTNSTQARIINTKLAELDQFEWVLKNETDQNKLYALNDLRKIDGGRLIEVDKNAIVTKMVAGLMYEVRNTANSNGEFLELPSIYILNAAVAKYRLELKTALAKVS